MENKKLNILLLSSYSQSHSGELGKSIVNAFKAEGHNVEWGYPGIDEQYKIIAEKRKRHTEIHKKYKRFFFISNCLEYLFGKRSFHFFDYKDENKPHYESPLDIDKINGEFDFIYVLFTSFMISAKTISILHQKFKCPIFLGSIDMYHIGGGCMYFGQCKKYKNECISCPNYTCFNKGSAHKNYLLKRQIYTQTNAVLACNTWVANIALDSKMFPKERILVRSYLVDDVFFNYRERSACKERLKIEEYNYVFMARNDSSKRKGGLFVEASLNKLYSEITEEQRDKTLLLLVGGNKDCTNIKCGFPTKSLGQVDLNTLIDAYYSADCFICGSIDDAGPSMVNQAMACGTPVVMFNIGTALDVLMNGVSGFKARPFDQKDFALCVNKIYNLKKEEQEELRISTKNTARELNSGKSIVEKIVKKYYEIQNQV